MMNKSYTFFLLSLLVFSSAHAEVVSISQFKKEGLTGWEEKSFVGNTQYSLIDMAGEKVLKASSHAAASGMFKEVRIDLERTPWLNWSWRIDNTLLNTNERQKSGDDYPARIYVIIDGGVFFWRTKALNFVWSSHQSKESHWPNAYTHNARMVVVQSGDEKLGQWVSEKRNIRQALQTQFGESFRYIDATAIMTDTDNTKGTAVAYYKKIFFSSH